MLNNSMKIKSHFGFSLIEVLIAMAIMSSSAMLLYVAWAGNQVRVQKMAINNQAAFYLDQIMAELEIKYAQRILQLPDSEQGVFEDNPKFSWRMKSKDFQMPDLRSILISDKQGQAALLMVVDQLTEYLNQSVKEMQVTVKYSANKKQSVEFTATTFLVDYNRSIPLGGAGGMLPPGAGGGAGGGGP
jgi:general secretion pathway protein I